jgi:hypothetical protein
MRVIASPSRTSSSRILRSGAESAASDGRPPCGAAYLRLNHVTDFGWFDWATMRWFLVSTAACTL